ncbi:MAG: hypothetical protein GY778_06655, partial [bacterium]|nr:hypothetical protein [bacterium]
PVHVGGQPQLSVAAVGSVLDGFGKFKGLQGNYILTGSLTAGKGFVGNVVIRLVDPDETLRAGDTVPPVQPAAIADPDPGITYLMFRSQKKGPEQRSSFSMSPAGQVRGIVVPLELRRVCIGYTSDGTPGLRSEIDFGAYVGRISGITATNPLAPGPGLGTPLSPFLFQGVSRYSFYDESDRTVGGFTAQTIVGRNFGVQLQGAPGQPALRFGYFGQIVAGSGYGCFAGVQGMMSGIAGVGIAPHVFSNLHLVRLADPTGRYRAAAGTGCQI